MDGRKKSEHVYQEDGLASIIPDSIWLIFFLQLLLRIGLFFLRIDVRACCLDLCRDQQRIIERFSLWLLLNRLDNWLDSRRSPGLRKWSSEESVIAVPTRVFVILYCPN